MHLPAVKMPLALFSIPLLLLLLLFSTVNSSHLHDERAKRNMLEDDPCLDAEEISYLPSVHFSARFGQLSLPWLQQPRGLIQPKAYISDGLRYQWTWVKSLTVRGIAPHTIDDVMRFLDHMNCSFIPFGSVVRETVMRRKPTEVTGEVSCPLEKIRTACLEKFGEPACGFEPNEHNHTNTLLIGDPLSEFPPSIRAQPLRLQPLGRLSGLDPRQWDYTVNTMSIFDNQAGEVYLIDVLGRGYGDTCERRIHPPVEETDWKEWAEEGMDKLLEYYSLRSRGFSPSSSKLRDFVAEQVKEKLSVKDVQAFYCTSILDGVLVSTGKTTTAACALTPPDRERKQRIQQGQLAMQHDMGSLWPSVKPSIDDIEAVYMTPQQLDELRQERKKKGDHSPHHTSIADSIASGRGRKEWEMSNELPGMDEGEGEGDYFDRIGEDSDDYEEDARTEQTATHVTTAEKGGKPAPTLPSHKDEGGGGSWGAGLGFVADDYFEEKREDKDQKRKHKDRKKGFTSRPGKAKAFNRNKISTIEPVVGLHRHKLPPTNEPHLDHAVPLPTGEGVTSSEEDFIKDEYFDEIDPHSPSATFSPVPPKKPFDKNKIPAVKPEKQPGRGKLPPKNAPGHGGKAGKEKEQDTEQARPLPTPSDESNEIFVEDEYFDEIDPDSPSATFSPVPPKKPFDKEKIPAVKPVGQPGRGKLPAKNEPGKARPLPTSSSDEIFVKDEYFDEIDPDSSSATFSPVPPRKPFDKNKIPLVQPGEGPHRQKLPPKTVPTLSPRGQPGSDEMAYVKDEYFDDLSDAAATFSPVPPKRPFDKAKIATVQPHLEPGRAKLPPKNVPHFDSPRTTHEDSQSDDDDDYLEEGLFDNISHEDTDSDAGTDVSTFRPPPARPFDRKKISTIRPHKEPKGKKVPPTNVPHLHGAEGGAGGAEGGGGGRGAGGAEGEGRGGGGGAGGGSGRGGGGNWHVDATLTTIPASGETVDGKAKKPSSSNRVPTLHKAPKRRPGKKGEPLLTPSVVHLHPIIDNSLKHRYDIPSENDHPPELLAVYNGAEEDYSYDEDYDPLIREGHSPHLSAPSQISSSSTHLLLLLPLLGTLLTLL